MPNTKQPAERADLAELRRLADPVQRGIQWVSEFALATDYNQTARAHLAEAYKLIGRLPGLIAEVEFLRHKVAVAGDMMKSDRAEIARLQGLSAATASRTVSDAVDVSDEYLNELAKIEFQQACGRPYPWEGVQQWVLNAMHAAMQSPFAGNPIIPAPSVAEPCAVEKGSHPWELRLIFETAEDAAKAYSAYSDSTKLASSRAPSVAEPAKCWCAHCERVQIAELPAIDRIFSRKFIVCPDCGNKRCPKATCHERACSGSNDPDQIGSRYGTDIPCGVHPASPDCTPASAEQASAASSAKQCRGCRIGSIHCGQEYRAHPNIIGGGGHCMNHVSNPNFLQQCAHTEACHTERKER